MNIGKTETLKAARFTEVGAYLTDGRTEVLLPKKQVPKDLKAGDPVTVFLYRDSEDRPIATVNRPYAEVGQFAYLLVKSTTKVGAFLDWGLEKDLLVPFKEQEARLSGGDRVLVRLYLDKSGRIAATTKIYEFLSPAAPKAFRENEEVVGAVYRSTREYGVFTAVLDGGNALEPGSAYDRLYFGLIPPSQVFKTYALGETVHARVVRVRQDGKLDISPRKRDFEQIEADAERILEKIRAYGGTLPFSEKTAPALIKRELNMSKNGFKKALGHLYKAHKIMIGEQEVRLVSETSPGTGRDSE